MQTADGFKNPSYESCFQTALSFLKGNLKVRL